MEVGAVPSQAPRMAASTTTPPARNQARVPRVDG